MFEDCRLFLGRKAAPANVVEAVLAAYIHEQGAGWRNCLFNREVDFIGAAIHAADRARRRMQHDVIAVLQTQAQQILDKLLPCRQHDNASCWPCPD